MKIRRKIEFSVKTNNSNEKRRSIPITRDIDLEFYLGFVTWGAFFEAVECKVGSAYERKKWTILIFNKISCRSDLGPLPGRKSRQEFEFEPGKLSKPLKMMKNWEISKLMEFLMKCILQSIFRLQIFKFPMLTHVCGVARGLQGYRWVTRRAYIPKI